MDHCTANKKITAESTKVWKRNHNLQACTWWITCDLCDSSKRTVKTQFSVLGLYMNRVRVRIHLDKWRLPTLNYVTQDRKIVVKKNIQDNPTRSLYWGIIKQSPLTYLEYYWRLQSDSVRLNALRLIEGASDGECKATRKKTKRKDTE